MFHKITLVCWFSLLQVLNLLYVGYSNSRISLVLLVLEIEHTLGHLRLNFAIGEKNDPKAVAEATIVVVASQMGLAGTIQFHPLASTSNFNIISTMLYLLSMQGVRWSS